MGVIREFRCPSCEKTWKLALGHGMRHGMLGRVMEAFPQDIQRKIVENVGKSLPLFTFHYKAAVCGQCRNLVALPVLELIESGHTYIGRCPQCHGEPELVKEESEMICPGCQEARVCVQDIGHWD